MTDALFVLTHPHNKLAKTWRADGSITPYDDAKFFDVHVEVVAGIAELSEVLTTLEADPQACVVRGQYKGHDEAAKLDPEHKPGRVRRLLDLWNDVPRHWMLVEVDNFEPLTADPVLDPVMSIDEFLLTQMPAPFHGVAYHWQLSNSAGHRKNLGKLKAHVWVWLEKPYTSAQLRAWATALALPIDRAVLNPVQVHYTSAPQFDPGVVDPVPVRSGFAEGLVADEVALEIDLDALPVVGTRQTKAARLAAAAEGDPIARLLYDRGMVKSVGGQGELRVVCPRSSEHTGPSAETATLYYLPHTGGFDRGTFACLHDHCRGVPQSLFHDAMGYNPVLDDFAPIADEGDGDGGEGEGGDGAMDRAIPEAMHLCTDQANANRIVKHFRRRLMVSGGKWYAWSGTHWKQDEGEVYRCALKLSAIVHREADQFEAKPLDAGDEDAAETREKVVKAIRDWARKSEMKGTIDAALNLTKRLLEVPATDLDQDPWALNCINGTVDLRTGKLRACSPEDYITKCVPFAYDPSVRSTLFEEILAKVTMEEGRTTKPVAAFIKRWFGYCITGSTREQKFVVHYGNGSNGKSTILDTISHVVGVEYAGAAAPGLLVGGKDRHPTEIADLRGRRMVTAHETGESGVLREDFVKQATGGDMLKARFMGVDFFEFKPTHKIQLLTNYKPIIRGQDVGIWRRVLLVPYLARFGSPEDVAQGQATHVRDLTVPERLLNEAQGVLTWLVEGAADWFTTGLRAPDSVLAASKDYQTEQDKLLQFVTEECELGPEFEAQIGDLYRCYAQWCKASGYLPLGKNRVSQEMERVVPCYKSQTRKVSQEGVRRNVVFIAGIRLCSEF